jgi:succinate dehydrogenase / fumarate reductase cytochrome b subunit
VGWTGAAILVFLVVHLLRFFVPNRVMNQPGFDLYLEAHTAFAFLPYTLFYTVCMVALALHLQHGIRSALFSFKLVKPSAIPRLRSVGSWVGFVVPLALAYIGVHLYVRSLM